MKRQKGKKKGQAKERVFGCDLVAHLEGTGHDVPQVLKACAEFIEQNGIVDGIYRLSGISSNIQKLRQEFDTEKTVDLSKDVYLQDIHCVSSLCKAYFRELPNPLLMYRLYDKFADAVNTQMEADRLLKIRQVLQELPPSHYRTLEYLMRHLLRMASHSQQTNMHARNLAIVWAPNLLRSKEIEMTGFNGTAAFMEVRVQSIVVEFILNHVLQLFGTSDHHTDSDGETERCQSLPCLSPTKEPAPALGPGRIHPSQIPHVLHLGDGPPAIKPYHTIIELPDTRRKGSLKVKKWRSIFNLGRSGNDSKRKLNRNEGKDLKTSSMTLRPAKSMDSLSSAPFTNDGTPPHGSSSLSRRDSFSSRPLDTEEPAFCSLPLEEGVRPILRGGPDSPRSAKEARERAGRRVALHISGPFSVSLPQHLGPLLNRAAKGQTPGVTLEGQGGPPLPSASQVETEDTAEEEETEGDELEEEEEEEEEEDLGEEEEDGEVSASTLPLMPEISLELQDTFSFLDSQDTVGEGDYESEYLGELGRPLRTPEEMDPSEYFPACEHSRAGGVDMSIESELMEREMDEGGLQEYHTQLHLQEFSVEPPCEDEWGPEEVLPLCPPSSLCCPTPDGGVSEEELDQTLLGPRDAGSREGCSAAAAPAGQGDLCDGSAEEKDDEHLNLGVAGQAEESGESWATCSDGQDRASLQEEDEEEEEELGREAAPTEGGMEGPQLTAVPMRLESSVVESQMCRALPVVPPKPHYTMLPPALKARSRPLTPSPAARSHAWRKKGSQSFDEAVARRRDQQGATSPHGRTFTRGDSLPSSGPAPPTPRDRLSLPPAGNLPPLDGASHAEMVPQPRCRSLALEMGDSE
ncbi:rho GTPase-activating protein 30-like [Hemitrygon akajei]|uniref:rho GTPase-activating protein 30-like n=1 Tax=Hemitrygon akajei TaxID=2704970 RepID=UPI003BFA271F